MTNFKGLKIILHLLPSLRFGYPNPNPPSINTQILPHPPPMASSPQPVKSWTYTSGG